MKKTGLILLLTCITMFSIAQDISQSAAFGLLTKNKAALHLSADDLNNMIISSAYHNEISSTDLVYVQQSHKGLPVFNQLQTLAFKNGVLVSNTGSRLKSIEKLSKMANAVPVITAESALYTAMADKKITPTQPITANPVSIDTKINFGKSGICAENITAELMWVPLNEGREVKLAWQIYLVPNSSSDYWLIRVDAVNNTIIGESNLTVYCNFDADKNHSHEVTCSVDNKRQPVSVTSITNVAPLSPSIVNSASYRVVPYPAESPNHPGGSPAIRTNPWTMAPGNATSLNWHSDGTIDYNISRGNNVWAREDRDGVNSTIGLPATSTTSPDPLTFDFVPDFSVTPTQTTPVQNQQFNITNLFYWNNIIHDLAYQYGFNEVAGNFQNNNQGRGGASGDFVIAEAQDGGGTNNANFSTPADGGSGRMQMYLWNGTPQKDGDVDNGIIIHEFSHGISNRLTGGPAASGCLGNSEQMGEGWSDYYALMATHNWATATVNDGFASPRGIGTYVQNQTPAGGGIRPRRYTTNMAINEMTYANLPSQAVPHGVGFVWCTMLWDMTWDIIQVAGINPNLFNPAGVGGNTIALKLVTEAMKLQPCSPGFIDGRNAILQADQLLYGGLYRCTIVAAFARRGLGFDAKQGSSGSSSDGTAGFSTVESNLSLTQTVTQQLEGLNVTYTNRVSAGTCSSLINYTLRDTLPSNVTYISGGSYNASTRVVSFSVNIPAGQSQDFAFTVQINNGSWFPTVTMIDEQVLTTSIPSTWVTSSINSTNFNVSSVQSQSPPNSFFGINAPTASDYRIATSSSIPLGAITPVFSFWHNHNTEDGWDGGLVEISTNGGTTWIDLAANMTENGYNGIMGTGSNNPLGGRAAFTGNSNGFKRTTISLTPYANQSAMLRFRVGSDDNTNEVGWYIDNILLKREAMVNIRSSLFNASLVRVNVSDTMTIILENAGCTPVSYISQPANTTACVGANASFNVTTTGSAITYQWQVSTDGGGTYSNIAGANSSTLNLTAVTAGMDNNRYKVITNNTCTSNFNSGAAILTVSNMATVTAPPANASVCLNGNTSFSVSATGSTLTYQWQVSTDAGASFNNLTGATAATLNLTAVTAGMNGNQYRAMVFSCGPTGVNSVAATLSILNPASITTQPATVTICPGANTTFTAAVNGVSLTYQWQVSSNGGTSYTNIGGAISNSLSLTGVNLALNGNLYRVVINGQCTVNLISNAATLFVNTPVSVTSQPANISGCAGNNVIFSVAATGTSLTYQWQQSVNGGPFVNINNGGIYAGVTTNTLTLGPITAAMNGYAYRVTVSGPPCGAITSNSASLIAYSLPAAVLVAAEYNRITPSVPSALYTTVSPMGTYTYQWYRDGLILNGVTNSSYPVNVDRFGAYRVIATDANGCIATTNLVNISDSATNQLYIYPNPNNGQFQVRYYSPNFTTLNRILNIYDAKGARIYSKQYTVVNTYGRMDVNMTNLSSGIYMVELKDVIGNKLASGMVVVQ